MKKTIFSLALLSLIASSCSDNTDITVPVLQSDKEMIYLSATDEGGVMSSGAATRAGLHQTAETSIAALFSSTNGTSSRHTRTLMTAGKDASQYTGTPAVFNWSSTSSVTYSQESNKRYWDDAFGRDGKISIYAISVPGKGSTHTNNGVTLENKLTLGSTNVSSTNTDWKTDAITTTIAWKATNEVDPTSPATQYTAQTTDIMADEDLCYSNNIQETGKDGVFEYGAHSATSTYPTYSYQATNNCHNDGTHDYYPNMDNGYLDFKLVDAGNKQGPGHFDHGHMIFKHAMTRITVDLKGGEGFDYEHTGFSIESQTTNKPATINLLKMNTSGTLDVKTGAWSGQSQSDNTYMFCGAKATGDNYGKGKIIYKLSAQIVPGNVVTDGETSKNFMTFKIDGNNYYVTEDQIFDALNVTANTTADPEDGTQKVTVNSNKITLEQGKNYHFTITVDKTGIQSLTCTLVDWVDVEAIFPATNAYITFNSLTAGNSDKTSCEHFDLYRVLNENNTVTDPTHLDFDGTLQYMQGWVTGGGYTVDKLSTDGATPGVTKNTNYSTTATWKTTWFFDNNKSFYHFRTVIPGTDIVKDGTPANGDYFTMYSGPIKDDYPASGTPVFPTGVIGGNETAKYNDYHWGAIFKSDASNLNYSTSNGFNDQLAGPVGPTTSTLNLIEQHMMSNIRVVLLTPLAANGSDLTNTVDLYNSAGDAPRKVSEVKITNFSGSGTVRMGNGLITPSTPNSTQAMTTPDATTEWSTPTPAPATDYCVSKTKSVTVGDETYATCYQTQAYTYRVVPQALVTGTAPTQNRVGITIQTPDDNMYYVVQDLSTIVPSSVTGNALKGDHAADGDGNYSAIDRWYPGYTYTYYFLITKTGIKALTCTIVDWVNVEANVGNINLEN